MINREIERKLYVDHPASLSQGLVDYELRRCLNPIREIYGNSVDTYYRAHGYASFVRLRAHDDGRVELTTKTKSVDGTNFNREELNLFVSPEGLAHTFCLSALGQPDGHVTKKYSVFFPGWSPTTAVSTYVVEGSERIYLEVEGETEGVVDMVVTSLKEILPLVDEPRSLFEIFIEPCVTPEEYR